MFDEGDVKALLRQGGDSRAVMREATGLTKYGCRFHPRQVIALGSCTASSPSPRAFAAAAQALKRLRRRDAASMDAAVEAHLEEVRQRLRALYLPPSLGDDVDVVLSPSGTDIEYLPGALVAQRAEGAPVTNVVIAPNEVGSGTLFATRGLFFDARTPTGPQTRGDSLSESLASILRREDVHVRRPDGGRRDAAAIDDDVLDTVAAAVARGEHVLVHRVVHTKTGIFAPTMDAITHLRQRYPERVHVVVDAAQGRVSPEVVAEALREGCAIFVTGSKFFGGPPFSAALFAPRSWRPVAQLRPELGVYMTKSMVPASWRAQAAALSERRATGLALRWSAALAEMELFWGHEAETVHQILAAFEEFVRGALSAIEGVTLRDVAPDERCVDPRAHRLEGHPTVFPFTVEDGGADAWGKERLNALHHHLNTAASQRFHLGQPVMLGQEEGAQAALRVAAGAALINDVAVHQDLGATLLDRIAWLRQRMDALARHIARGVEVC